MGAVLYIGLKRIIRRPPDDVWAFMTDVMSLPSLVSGLVEARLCGETQSGTGVLVDIVIDANGKRHLASSEVTRWQQPSLLTIETRARGVLVLDRVALVQIREGTELAVNAELKLGPRLVERFVTARRLGVAEADAAIEQAYERSLDALVKRVEMVDSIPYR